MTHYFTATANFKISTVTSDYYSNRGWSEGENKQDLKGSINVLSGLKHGITLGLREALIQFQGGRVLGF